jgi:hypothetical protein
MKRPSMGTGRGTRMPGGLVEAVCETSIALAIAAAVCMGVVSLSAHLEQAHTAHAFAAKTATADMPAAFAWGAAETRTSTDLE